MELYSEQAYEVNDELPSEKQLSIENQQGY